MEIEKLKRDTVINVLSFIILAVTTLALILFWKDIPETVVTHYGFKGQPDIYGSKNSLIFLPVVSWCIWLLLTVAGKYPKIWNVPQSKSEKAQKLVYRTMFDMLNCLKLTMVSFTSVLILFSAFSTEKLPSWFTFLFLILLFAEMFLFVQKEYKEAKTE